MISEKVLQISVKSFRNHKCTKLRQNVSARNKTINSFYFVLLYLERILTLHTTKNSVDLLESLVSSGCTQSHCVIVVKHAYIG